MFFSDIVGFFLWWPYEQRRAVLSLFYCFLCCLENMHPLKIHQCHLAYSYPNNIQQLLKKGFINYMHITWTSSYICLFKASSTFGVWTQKSTRFNPPFLGAKPQTSNPKIAPNPSSPSPCWHLHPSQTSRTTTPPGWKPQGRMGSMWACYSWWVMTMWLYHVTCLKISATIYWICWIYPPIQ